MNRKMGYLRNFVFGVEDSLVSTVGLLSGVAAVGSEFQITFTTGVILILVEALSMAIGSFLSENSAEEYAEHKEESLSLSIPDSLIKFISYFISGFVPLFPYIFLPAETALPISIAASLVALCALGVVSSKVSQTSIWKGITKMVILGGVAIAAGVAVGSFLG